MAMYVADYNCMVFRRVQPSTPLPDEFSTRIVRAYSKGLQLAFTIESYLVDNDRRP